MEKENFECDLHCHTTRSDGADSPQELIDHAAEAGLKVVAVTDHDVVPPDEIVLQDSGEVIDICKYAQLKGIKLIRGIEISCETEVDDVHIVCFGCDWKDSFFIKLEQDVISSKIEGYQLLVKCLKEHGMDIAWEEVLDNNGSPVRESQVQKKMIFELIARKGYTKDWSEAKLMVKNTPEYQIRRPKPDPCEVIREVHRCGGFAIMAHPFLVDEPVHMGNEKVSRADYIEHLIRAGLDGIEACYTYDKTSYDGTMTKNEIRDYITEHYAGRLRVISGGSDYHADARKGVRNPRNLGEGGVTQEYFRSNVLLQTLV